MASILRPLKTGGTRTYVEEYALGNQFAKDSEVDADLKTIYDAWNHGIPPVIEGMVGAVSFWADTNTALQPLIATRHIQLASINAYFMAGTGTKKSRLGEFNTGVFQWRCNLAPGPIQDDNTHPSWVVSLDCTGTDSFQVQHREAGDTVSTVPFQVRGSDGQTICTLSSGSKAMSGFMFDPLCRVTVNTQYTQWGINNTPSMPGYDQSLAGWSQTSYTQVANPWWQIHHKVAGEDTLVKLFEVRGEDLQCSIPLSAGLEVGAGTNIKIRIQNTGGQGGVYFNRDIAKGNVQDNVNSPSWAMEARDDLDAVLIRRTPDHSTSALTLLTVDGASIGNLTIAGSTAYKPGGGSWTTTSDARMKRNVADYGMGLDAITQLRPVSFEYNGELGSIDTGKICYGFVAQEVQPVMPECVSTIQWSPDVDEPATKPAPVEVLTLDQSNMVLALVNAVKELATRMVALENK